jgi:hypothetical protein
MNWSPRRNKFGAKSIKIDGKGYPSLLEASVHGVYKLMESAGEITELRHQHTVHFTDAKISWRLDFSFKRDGELRFGEAKGFETTDYLIKLKLWRVYGIAPLEIWKGNHKAPRLTETVIPIAWKETA